MIFKPEDFYSRTWIQEYIGSPVSGKVVSCLDAADIANKLFQEWLEKQPVVYSFYTGAIDNVWTEEQSTLDSHKARLVCIEPIQKKCEKHEPIELAKISDAALGLGWKCVCKHCGVELVAEWRAK